MSAAVSRRFPPPWSVEELDESFVVKDVTGQADCRSRPSISARPFG